MTKPEPTAVRSSAFLDKIVVALVRIWTEDRGRSLRAKSARQVLKAFGVDWQPIAVGPGLSMPHATTGSVVHVKTRIGSNVTVFHGVTVGRSDPWGDVDLESAEGVVLEDDVVLGAHAVVLFRRGQEVRVRKGTVLGASSVLLQSTGESEVWAGNPAVRIR